MRFPARRSLVAAAALVLSIPSACAGHINQITAPPTPLDHPGGEGAAIALLALLATAWVLGRRW